MSKDIIMRLTPILSRLDTPNSLIPQHKTVAVRYVQEQGFDSVILLRLVILRKGPWQKSIQHAYVSYIMLAHVCMSYVLRIVYTWSELLSLQPNAIRKTDKTITFHQNES